MSGTLSRAVCAGGTCPCSIEDSAAPFHPKPTVTPPLCCFPVRMLPVQSKSCQTKRLGFCRRGRRQADDSRGRQGRSNPSEIQRTTGKSWLRISMVSAAAATITITPITTSRFVESRGITCVQSRAILSRDLSKGFVSLNDPQTPWGLHQLTKTFYGGGTAA
jgi:hypothetical protein